MYNFLEMSFEAYKSMPSENKLSTDPKKIIFKNKQWEVYGDASLNCESKGYYIDGYRIMEGMTGPEDKEILWPEHVCKKIWVDENMFLEAYGIAYRHYKVTEQLKLMDNERHS
jgi:hypothetical protein